MHEEGYLIDTIFFFINIITQLLFHICRCCRQTVKNHTNFYRKQFKTFLIVNANPIIKTESFTLLNFRDIYF